VVEAVEPQPEPPNRKAKTTASVTPTFADQTYDPGASISSSQTFKHNRTDGVAGKDRDNFAKETGKIQCIADINGGDKQCKRKAPKEVTEEERATWICHLHSKAAKAAGVNKEEMKMAPSQDDNSKLNASTKRVREATPSIGERLEEAEGNGDEYEEEAEEEEAEEEEDKEPPKKRAKSATKSKSRKGKGHSANRADNDP
jgi:hypothetical protein